MEGDEQSKVGKKVNKELMKKMSSAVGKSKPEDYTNTALWCFPSSNPLRAACIRIAHSKAFEWTVLLLILGNCVFLAMTEPFAPCCVTKPGDACPAVPDTFHEFIHVFAEESETKTIGEELYNKTITGYDFYCDAEGLYKPRNIDENAAADSEAMKFEKKFFPCCIDPCIKAHDLTKHLVCASQATKDAQKMSETFFQVAFSVEMFIKIVAMGFIWDAGAYLRDAWNCLDFFVVLIGYLAMLPGIANLSSLRTFRVFRPLRTLSSIPGMKPIVNSMIRSIPKLTHVAILCVFLFTIFGVIALQLWSGILTARCFYTGSNETALFPENGGEFDFNLALANGGTKGFMYSDNEAPCPLPCWNSADKDSTETQFGISSNETRYYRGSESQGACITLSGPKCAAPAFGWATDITAVCLDTGENQLGDGNAHFDNIGSAVLAIFTSITLEGWVDVMYAILGTFGYPGVVIPYFILMVLCCAMFMLELTLAVIGEEYDSAREAEEQAQAEWKAAFGLDDDEEADTPGHTGDDGEVLETGNFGWTDKPWGPSWLRKLHSVVQSPWFNGMITLLIVLNTATLAMEHHDMEPGYANFLKSANLFFTIAFTVEMVLKIPALGLRGYMMDSFNVFDFVIVWVSLIELIMEFMPAEEKGGSSGLSVLRTFRLLRVFKLARSWEKLRHLLATILLSVMDAANASILLIIIMFIFTLLGLQVFGGKWTANVFCDDPTDFAGCEPDKPRAHFDSLGWGFVTVFQVLTGENWNEVLYIGINSSGGFAIVYFVLLNIVGNYMILNLFLAILLNRFENDDEEEEEDGPQGNLAQVIPINGDGSIEKTESGAEEGDALRDDSEPDMSMKCEGKSLFILDPTHPVRKAIFAIITHGKFDAFILFLIGLSSVFLALDAPCDKGDVFAAYKDLTEDQQSCNDMKTFLSTGDQIVTTFFTIEMILKILGLGFFMNKASYLRDGWNMLDFAVVLISLYGIYSEVTAPEPVKGVEISAGNAGTMKALRSLRALRALRPLRVVRRFPQMKVVVNSMIQAMPDIGNCLMVVIIFFVIFAVMGVQQFKGGLNKCNDFQTPWITNTDMFSRIDKASCVGNFTITGGEPESVCHFLPDERDIEQCTMQATFGDLAGTESWVMQRHWGPTSYNFDHVGEALLVVFEVSSGEMWPDIMYDTQDIDDSPATNSAGVKATEGYMGDNPMLEWPHLRNQNCAVWFVLVTIVCAFLMLNVFVGVVIENFNKMKELSNGSGLLTEDQKLFVETMKIALSEKPIVNEPLPWDPCEGTAFSRIKMQRITSSTKFEMFIMLMIILNCLVMVLRHQGQSEAYTLFIDNANRIFAYIFIVEALLKLYATDKRYFTKAWNIFDFTLVVLSIVGMTTDVGALASLFRIFRVARIFRLVRTSPGLLNLFKTLMYSIPSMWNVGAILMLIMFIFAVMGMQLFSGIKYGDLLNEDANFDSFGTAMLTLFRCATGESFNGIMHDCMVEEPFCSATAVNRFGEPGNCGYPGFAPFYFVLYFTLSAYVLLSMITAIVLDNFSDTQAAANGVVTEDHIDAFKAAWSKQDKAGTQYIATDGLCQLIMDTPYPLGVKDQPGIFHQISIRKAAHRVMMKLEVVDIDGKLAFQQTLAALSKRAMNDSTLQTDIPGAKENKMVARLRQQEDSVRDRHLKRQGSKASDLPDYNVGQKNAANQIQASIRGYIYRQQVDQLRQNALGKGAHTS